MTKTVEFDPGIAQFAGDLYTEAYIIENDMANMPQFARKVRYYSVTYKKLLKVILGNLGFYNACLAWAYYIVNTANDAVLSGNPFISYTEEQKAQYAPTDGIDFCIEYTDKFISDLKYFNIKGVTLPERTKEILSKYREFVAINEGFLNTEKVSDIKLPENLTFATPLKDIKKAIDEAITKENLTDLINLK